MLFNSLEFAVFLVVVFSLFWSVPQRFRWVVLCAASYFFYGCWSVKYLLLILLQTAVSFYAAKAIAVSHQKGARRAWLAVTLVVCLGILGLFKYFNFFADSLVQLLGGLGLSVSPVTLNLLLPVGISFYTFQSLSYVIDVYRKEVEPEKSFFRFATFVAFFPQLVAGPIERTGNLLPQINKQFCFSYQKATYGMKLMAWGLFKKIVVADTLAVYVDTVYNSVHSFTGFALIGASVLFAFQIYCDFSGYSDIAIGVAKLFDIDLMRNFHSPYVAVSIREFWSRWHISLSTWFKDYVYIPLGGNRCSRLRRSVNLLVTFLVSGLWHGANWTFVVWGAIHGLGQVVENFLPKKKSKPGKLLGWLFVFGFVVCGWVFFRAQSLEDAAYVFTHCFRGLGSPVDYLVSGLRSMGFAAADLGRMAVSLAVLLCFDFFNAKTDLLRSVGKLRAPVRWLIYIGFVCFTIYMLPNHGGGEFIYFQF